VKGRWGGGKWRYRFSAFISNSEAALLEIFPQGKQDDAVNFVFHILVIKREKKKKKKGKGWSSLFYNYTLSPYL